MKRVMLCMLAVLLLSGTVFGCAETSVGPISEPTAQPSAEPTAAPIDPFAQIDEAEIREGRHEREEDYPNPFHTHWIDTPFAAVHLENGENCSDEALRALAKNVVADIRAFSERTGGSPEKITVYIIRNLLRDRPVLLGDHMICSSEQVENGAYREALCGACFDLSIPWKQVGLSEYVFGTVDESGLTEYYADEANALTASCAAVYFLEEIAGKETAAAARKTAASMTRCLLDSGGFDALRKVVSTAEILPAWTAQLGIEPITLPVGHERTAIMTAYRDKTPNRLCVLGLGNITLRVNKGSPLVTADELYAFACKMLYGLDFELDAVRAESSILAETADRRASEPIMITLSDDPTQSGISTGSQYEVNLVSPYAVWHELMHALLWSVGSNVLPWMQEGLAEHYSRGAASIAVSEPEAKSLSDWFADSVEPEGETLAFYEAMWRVYCAERKENPAVPSDQHDDWAFRRAMGICELLLPYDPFKGNTQSTVSGVRGAKVNPQETDGGGLSYPEAMVVFEYLLDTYGADAIADCILNNRTLSETCGKEYPELYADCVAYLRETYGAILTETNN